ncbi:MAG: hypothetical protein ACOCSR_04635, partial [Wenzhouxiangella sp.]
ELDIHVIFCGAGCGHLVGEAARGWRQLIDFDLAGLWYERDCLGGREPEIAGIRSVDPEEITCMKEQGRAVLAL